MKTETPYPKPTQRKPSFRTMVRWVEQGVGRATDGCWIRVDGICPHGHPSWLLVEKLA